MQANSKNTKSKSAAVSKRVLARLATALASHKTIMQQNQYTVHSSKRASLQ